MLFGDGTDRTVMISEYAFNVQLTFMVDLPLEAMSVPWNRTLHHETFRPTALRNRTKLYFSTEAVETLSIASTLQ